jgi:hypothetical protein
MRLWRRVAHTPDYIVAAARDFFVNEFLIAFWITAHE